MIWHIFLVIYILDRFLARCNVKAEIEFRGLEIGVGISGLLEVEGSLFGCVVLVRGMDGTFSFRCFDDVDVPAPMHESLSHPTLLFYLSLSTIPLHMPLEDYRAALQGKDKVLYTYPSLSRRDLLRKELVYFVSRYSSQDVRGVKWRGRGQVQNKRKQKISKNVKFASSCS